MNKNEYELCNVNLMESSVYQLKMKKMEKAIGAKISDKAPARNLIQETKTT